MPKSDDERTRRLAEALRTNLRRRKAQARGESRVLGDEPASLAPPSAEPPEGGTGG